MAKTTAEKVAKPKEMSWREYERQTDGVKAADALKIELGLIHVRKGFNPRDLSKPETQDKIRAIADSYKAGRYVKPIEVALSSGHTEVVDGHCRLEAAKLANTELDDDKKIKELMCVPFKGSDLDRLVHTYLGNEGEKLTPLECSEVVRRMQDTGLQRQPIADALGVTIGWVDRLIVVAKLPEEVKAKLREGKVSLDVALKKFKQHGSDVAGAVNAVIAEAEAKGEGKATTKHTRKADPKLDKSGMIAAMFIGRHLPEQTVDFEAIKEGKQYTVKVPGIVLKSMMALKAKVDEMELEPEPEPEPEVKEASKSKSKKGEEAWPFEGQKVAEKPAKKAKATPAPQAAA